MTWKSSVAACVVVLASAWSLMAADLTISGEAKYKNPALVKLKATGHEPGAGLLWKVYPRKGVAFATTTTEHCEFVAPTPGTYTVDLDEITATVVDGKSRIATRSTSMEVVIDGAAPVPPGPTPPGPTPPPDPNPDPGVLGLKAASRDGAAKVAADAATRRKLADANRGVASAIAAGGVQPATPAGYLAAWGEANASAVDAATWRPWGDTVSAKLKELYAAKKLATKADWVAAFNEIADGLE